jgi:hypothetical protein
MPEPATTANILAGYEDVLTSFRLKGMQIKNNAQRVPRVVFEKYRVHTV